MEDTGTSQNNRRIARNTLMLYMRMLLTMAVSLFSFRILLKELGDTDYGIYNVVGGIVVLFSFLSSAMTQSTQRYLSYYIGKGDSEKLGRIFSMSINVHIFIAGIVFVLAETIGLWFLNTCMNFPEGSMRSVNVVYQCSAMTFMIQIMTAPYQAAIISHERMSFYAYFSIIEVLLKLSAVLVLTLFKSDRLIIYSCAILAVGMIIWNVYHLYCVRRFIICRYNYFWDRKLFKELTKFSGWNMLGGIGNVGASQGVNIIFNIFCGVTMNAAMGVANQVSAAVAAFVGNFQTAFNPQIIKSYASEDKDYFLSLIFRASRFSFFLIFILGYPIILCCPAVFEIWLTNTPQYAVPFTRLIIMFCMIDAMSGPLWTAAQASGRIKEYMLIIATMIFTNVPAAYIILHLGFSPVYVIGYKVVMNLLIHFTRIVFLHKLIAFPSLSYLRRVMLPILIFVLISIPAPLFLLGRADTITDNIPVMAFTVCECAVLGFYILLERNERKQIILFIKTKFGRT